MRIIRSLAVFAALVTLEQATLCLAAQQEGLALAIVYDTSGSMQESVRDKSGGSAPKYVIANRALLAVVDQVQAFATNASSGTARKVEAGLFTFDGNSARQSVRFGPFDPKAMKNWALNFSNPQGNTPLGNALTVAGRAVMDSPMSRKHVLIITDGMNTAGPKPEATLPTLQKTASGQGAAVSVHFIAFDVAAKEFEPVKKQGATVVGAADEKQLETQLNYILQQKILLEEEEPKPAK
jgi:hypothetical protein